MPRSRIKPAPRVPMATKLVGPDRSSRKRRPAVAKRAGAPDVWGAKGLAFCREAKAAGIDRMIVNGSFGAADTEAMLKALRTRFLPNTVGLLRPGGDEPEIARIAGAEVWVSGTPTHTEYGSALIVSEYRILSVDGDIPVVGILGEDDTGFFITKDDRSVVRVDVNDRLAGELGAKVWIVLGADNVTVSRYGILRD